MKAWAPVGPQCLVAVANKREGPEWILQGDTRHGNGHRRNNARSAWSRRASRGPRERSRLRHALLACSHRQPVILLSGFRDKGGQEAGMLFRIEMTDNPSKKFKKRPLGPFSTGTSSPAALRGVMAASPGGRLHAQWVLVRPRLGDSGQPS